MFPIQLFLYINSKYKFIKTSEWKHCKFIGGCGKAKVWLKTKCDYGKCKQIE